MYHRSRFMKNAGAAGVLALSLITFLVLPGCPFGTVDAGGSSEAESAAQDLASQLGDTVASVSGTTVTIKADATVTTTLPLSSGVTLSIPANKTLTADSGAVVTVAADATVAVAGEFTVAGTVNVAADAKVEVASGGVYNVTNNGTSGTNYGTITVKAGGKIKAGGSNLVNGTGLHVVEAGGEAYYDNAVLVGHSGSVSPIVKLSDGSFSWNNEQYNLNGNAILTTTFRFASTSAALKLTIQSGKTLTVTGALYGAIAGQKIDNTAGTITISGGGTNNFYVASTPTAETSIAAAIYTWETNAGGSNNAGWQRPSS